MTNRSEYVFEGYEVGALRYLLKPVEETKLFSLLDEISYALGKERRYLIENVGGETVKIPVDTIYSVEAKGHYIRLHTSAGDYEYKKRISRDRGGAGKRSAGTENGIYQYTPQLFSQSCCGGARAAHRVHPFGRQ